MADRDLPKSDPENPPSVSPGDTDEAAGTEPSGNSAPSTVPITASAHIPAKSGPKPTHPNPNYPDQQLSQEEIEAQKPRTSAERAD